MIENEEKKWFVVQIKLNSYDLATRNLQRQGFEAFLPKMTITNRKTINFFKGYSTISGIRFCILQSKTF